MRTGILYAGIFSAVTAAAMAHAETLLAQNAVQETNRVLNSAKSAGDAESAKVTREQNSDGGALDRLAREAQRALGQSPGDQQRLSADTQKLDDTLKTLSPEAQKLLAQNGSVPAMRAPDPDAAAAAAKAAPAVPQPKPVAGAAKKADATGGDAPPVKKDNDVHITGQGAAYFDSKEMIGVFTDDVEVVHPQFHLYCEQLEIYMLKDKEKQEIQQKQQAAATAKSISAPASPSAPVIPGAIVTSTSAARTGEPNALTPSPGTPATPAKPDGKDKEPQQDSSIRQAIARGPKVVIIKNTENGDPQIGVCRNATYVGENGDIILRDMPLVQRDNNVHYATDPSTYMIIKQDGQLKTFGPSQTDIIQQKEKKEAAPSAAPAAPVTPPPPTSKPATKPAGPKKGKL